MNGTPTLEERLAAVERANRRMTRGIVLGVVLVAAIAGMGQRAAQKKPATPPVPRVVEAERFIVKKTDGQIVATFGVTDGVPVLRMNGPDFTERLTISLDPDGRPRVVFLARDGRRLAQLAVGPEGETFLDLQAAGGATRLAAGAGAVELGFRDTAGHLRAGLSMDEETTGFSLNEANGTTRALLAMQERGPGLILSDATGTARVALTVRPEQSGLGISDAKGDVRAGLAVRGSEPAFALYDQRGRAFFSK